MATLRTMIYFILMLSGIILIHEFGHFIFAKLFHVYVNEFSLGMGPQILKWQGRETVYSWRLLPVGGYCAMAGEDDHANIQETDGLAEVPPERTITAQAWYKKVLIMIAGPLMNFLLAWCLFVGIYASIGYKVINPPAYINGVADGSAAETAGFKYGDQILKVTFSDGTSITPKDFYDIIEETYYHHDNTVYTVSRGGETLDISVTPAYNEADQRYEIGIMAPESSIEQLDALGVVKAGTDYFCDSASLIGRVLKKLVRGIGLDNLSGPVGIYSATAQELKYGWVSFLMLVGLLSLNVGLMNLLPVPLFDGGRIVLTLIEAVIRKPLPKKVENGLMIASLVFVALLFILVTYNDLNRLL